MLNRSKSPFYLILILLLLPNPLAWGDCGDPWPDDAVRAQVQNTKKVPPQGWKSGGFYYFFSLDGSEIYFNLESQGGMSGEPLYTASIYEIHGDKIEFQCFNEVDLGSYSFKVQPDKKTFTISGASGCNDHSADDCEPVTEKYNYVWNGLAFYTTKDIARSKANLKKLLSAIKKKDQKTVTTLIKLPDFYPALSKEDVDDGKETGYNDFSKSKAATFAIMNFEVKEALSALNLGEDPFRRFKLFSEIADSVFYIYDKEGSQRKIFPEDRAYTQLINDIGFTYQQLWEQLLKNNSKDGDTKLADSLASAFENAKIWLYSAKSRDPDRAVVYLNLSDLFRVWNEKKLPSLKDEPEALLKSQCFGSKYVELMKKIKQENKIPGELTIFLGDKVSIASRQECKKVLL